MATDFTEKPPPTYVGQYADLRDRNVAANEGLHRTQWNLPLFPPMKIQVRPLAKHRSRSAAGEVVA